MPFRIRTSYALASSSAEAPSAAAVFSRPMAGIVDVSCDSCLSRVRNTGKDSPRRFPTVSRRRPAPIEEMLLRFVELPFRASILGAAFIYLAFRFLPPVLAGDSMAGKTLGTVLPTIAPWLATAILAAGLTGVARRQWRRFLLSRADSLESIRQLDWADFERLVGEAYRRQGFTVIERGGPQPDGGIDLQLSRGGERIVVQCKHWKNRQVPVQRVRELLGVVTAEGADRGILVATAGFTRDALDFANGKPLELLDGEALARLARTTKQPETVPNATMPIQPTCPQCGKPMVSRTARRGPKIGSQFWGCSSYPECRGTRAA